MNDRELTRAAQNGDAGALGVLVERHEAGVRAVALSLLGPGPDAEDAVQDAMVTAILSIEDVRDPAAVGSWLRSIVRNNCRMRLRAKRPYPVADLEWFLSADDAPGAEELLERTLVRDWVWHAMESLSENDRLITMVRHFSSVRSYEQIAAVCGIPVGTVRSRLHHAHRKLAAALRATADMAYADVSERTEARRREAADTMTATVRGDFHQVVGDLWWPDARLVVPAAAVSGGTAFAVQAMENDLEVGVRPALTDVVAGGDVLIWELELISPASNPDHCPPSAVWLQSLDGGRVRTVTLFHPAPAGKKSGP
ncbi:RNA polymerase sigma factor [Streptomyces brasiliensis]|uniref:DNA-directed RNA polymerase sigma-70 factor n=1 Tax=Streptomyces brasiliensis TaxID=1954 RepID=A0A917P388_9ACTN|nr:sigma-70 family RNA polymerase sigma factor [Streptomyces brasiliensis]GGJ58304.1 DNA-directed RNA polymerase sigma-70 factor [Streptomyces brasiliensis]